VESHGGARRSTHAMTEAKGPRREGSLEAPTRHPIDWRSPEFTDPAALDRELNEHGYILPGLGDAGDRIFGTR